MKNIEDRFKSDIDKYINGNFKLKIKLMKSEKLNNIRNIINDIFTNNGVFLCQDGKDGNKINIKISNNNINNTNNLSNHQ